MELEGLKRGLAYLIDQQKLEVKDLVTDRHVMIKKYMKDNRPDVNHYFDVWHIAKGFYFNLLFIFLCILLWKIPIPYISCTHNAVRI